MKKTRYRTLRILGVLILSFGNYFNVRAFTEASSLISASTYFVSTSGSDANACTQSLPCKTIKKGTSVAQSGDTIMVTSGVYHEYVYIDKSITIVSNGATIDGIDASGSVTDGLVSVVASNVKFQGFTISNTKYYGLANFGNNNQFVNNIIHHTQGAGIWMRDGKFNTFDGNELHDTVLQNSVSFDGTHYVCSPTNVAWPSAINSWGAASSNTWRNNNVHDNCGEGIVTITGDLIENNKFKDNWSVEIYIANKDAVVRNNTIIDTRPYTPRGSNQSWRSVPAGITIGDESACLSDNSTITGNNITGARYGISFYSYISCSGIKNSLIENNSIISTWEYGLRILTGAHTNSTIRNNTIQSTSGKPLTIQNSGFVMTGNILFSNVNVIEWNGKSYDFAGWNKIVPGNFWGTSGTATTTLTPTLIPPTSTIIVPTTTLALPTSTTSSIPVLSTNTPESIIPTTTPIVATTSVFTNTPIPTITELANLPSVVTTTSPKSLAVGAESLVTVSLNNVPVDGYRSVEFTCTYPLNTIEVKNVLMAGLFGVDPVAALIGPQNGSFIVAISGSNGKRAATNEAAFTFNVRGLQSGQAVIECKGRVSRGDNNLENILSGIDNLTILENSPTATFANTSTATFTNTPTAIFAEIPTTTPIAAPLLTGQVLANKLVTISLFNPDASLAATITTNADGTFSLTAPAGIYTIIASAEGYLNSQGSTTLATGVHTTMPVVNLPAGDIDGNHIIDQLDVLTLGMSYNMNAPAAAELNKDGIINILDLEVLSENYRKSGALSW